MFVLIPTVESKFPATWQGPFEVAERTGEVNYRANHPGKRKLQKIYHVNHVNSGIQEMHSLVVA